MTYIPGGGGGGGSIASSSDVALNNTADGEVLTYDTSVQKWTNATPAASTVDTSLLVAAVIYDGATYPARPTGYASVQWIGPVDPGAAALDNDTWINTAAQ